MKKYLIFAVFCGVLILSGCDSRKENISFNYYKDSNSVYRKYRPEGSISYVYKEIENADPDTFEVLNEFISKDKNNIFLFLNILNGVDHDTFSVYGSSNYAKDKDHIYFINWKSLSNPVNIIEGADRDSFEFVYKEEAETRSYAKDKNKVFQDEKVLSGVSSDEFEVIEGLYLKDKNAVYGGSLRHKLKGADPKTFRLIEYKVDSSDKIFKSSYAKDKNNIYCYNRNYYSNKSFGDGVINLNEENDDSIAEANMETFEVTGFDTAKDKNHSYKGCNIIK